MFSLTRGQEAVRQIITNKLPKLLAQTNSNYPSDELVTEVISEFSQRQEIHNDAVVGRYEDYIDISFKYKDYLAYTGRSVDLDDDFPVFKLDKFIYDIGPDERPQKLYKGGCKFNTTVSILFALARNQSNYMWGTHLIYYEKSGILTAMQGTHRTLAHVLWGEPRIYPWTLTLCTESKVDTNLNQALLQLDKSGIGDYLRFKNYSDDEVEQIKWFAFEATSDELEFITNFCSSPCSAAFTDEPLGIDWFVDCLLELRAIQKTYSLKPLIYNLKKAVNRPIYSDFERWYFDYRLRTIQRSR